MELNNNSNSGNKLAIDIISKKDEVKVAGTKKKEIFFLFYLYF